MKITKYLFPFMILLLIVFSQDTAMAQGNIVTNTLEKFQQSIDSWGNTLNNTAKSLFGLTLIIEICLFGIRVTLQRNQPSEIIGQFATLLLFAGFIWAVINNYQAWSGNIVNGLQGLAGQLNHSFSKAQVGEPYALGTKLAGIVLEKAAELTDITDIPQTLMLLITALILTITFVLISAIIILVKAEFLILSNIGLLLIGLGGSRIFKDYAINVMRYIFAVAVKLMVLQIIVSIGLDMIVGLNVAGRILQSNGEGLYGNLLVAICASLLLLCLAKTLPDTIGGLMNGSHINSSNPLALATSSVGHSLASGVVTAGATAVNAVNNVRLANTLAKEQSRETGVQGTGRLQSIRNNLAGAKMQSNPNTIPNQLKSMTNAQRASNALKAQDPVASAPVASNPSSATSTNGHGTDMTKPPKNGLKK